MCQSFDDPAALPAAERRHEIATILARAFCGCSPVLDPVRFG
jgi:hypothetical protein